MFGFREFIDEAGEEGSRLPSLEWDKDPKIGWWGDGDHLTMYHGTHESRLPEIEKHGIVAPDHGPTAGWVSMTHDPNTAHGYASMTGGESAFRAAGAKAQTVPHHERVVLVAKIPRDWAEKNMNPHLRGNIEGYRERLNDRSLYDKHTGPDHEYYAGTELRFKDRVPREFLVGHMRRYPKED